MTSLRTILLILLLASSSMAADIQYDLATGDVTGVRDEPIPVVPGHGVVSIPEAASAIQWPHPAGCTSAEINPGWVRLTDPGSVDVTGAGMALRPEVEPFLFTTTSPLLPGCHVVGRWQELKRLYEETIVAAVEDLDLVNAIGVLNTWKSVRCVSPGDDSNQNCIDWAAQMSTINQRLPGRGQGITTATDIATLITDAFAFKTAKGW